MDPSVFKKEIKRILEKNECALIIGAGVTIGAVADGGIDCSWKGLLKSGLGYCEAYIDHLDKDWLNRRIADLDTGDIYSCLAVAYEVEKRLKDKHAALFSNWLDAVVGGLKINDHSVLDAIGKLSANSILVTTNYDDFLKIRMPLLDRITWLDFEQWQKVLDGTDKAIIHMHGFYKRPETVILGVSSYDRILYDDKVTLLQHKLVLNYNMLFVGCGEGVNDPDFGLLLNEMGKRESSYIRMHYLLLREEDIYHLNQNPDFVILLKKANVQLVSYGKNFADLAPFLDSLALEKKESHFPLQYDGYPISREQDIEKIKRHLKNPKVKLITVTGAAGLGKTHIAVQVAKELMTEKNYRVRFIRLESIGDPKLVPIEIATAVGYPQIKDLPSLVTYLDGKNYLLVIDNFEQVIKAAEDIQYLLENCNDLKIVITSQLALKIPGQPSIELAPLQVPPATEIVPSVEELLKNYPSVRLLVERVKDAKEGFELTDDDKDHVTKICILAAGIPLAIVIIAGLSNVLTLAEIRQKMEKEGFLAILNSQISSKKKRHLTLQNAFQWSYNLLLRNQQSLFRALSVFEGSFTYPSTLSLFNAEEDEKKQQYIFDGLRVLKERSMIRVQEQYTLKENRFAMLEPLKAFGVYHLKQTREYDKTRLQHAKIFLRLVEEAALKLNGRTKKR